MNGGGADQQASFQVKLWLLARNVKRPCGCKTGTTPVSPSGRPAGQQARQGGGRRDPSVSGTALGEEQLPGYSNRTSQGPVRLTMHRGPQHPAAPPTWMVARPLVPSGHYRRLRIRVLALRGFLERPEQGLKSKAALVSLLRPPSWDARTPSLIRKAST